MNTREYVIRKYFNGWIKNDNSVLVEVFSDDVVYSECYGPEYHGLNQIILWFNEWNKHGQVIRWDIKQFIHENNTTVVEWYFECEYDSKRDGFNGVSIIEFTTDNKIKLLKEFESKAEHTYPYDN